MAKEQGVLAPKHALQLRVPVSGRDAPITSGCDKNAGMEAEEDENFWSPR